MNPFGSSDPIDQYNPFSQEDSTVSSNTPSESKQKLSFDGLYLIFFLNNYFIF